MINNIYNITIIIVILFCYILYYYFYYFVRADWSKMINSSEIIKKEAVH